MYINDVDSTFLFYFIFFSAQERSEIKPKQTNRMDRVFSSRKKEKNIRRGVCFQTKKKIRKKQIVRRVLVESSGGGSCDSGFLACYIQENVGVKSEKCRCGRVLEEY